MQLIETVSGIRRWREAQGSRSVGFVPTMGYLHEGHLSLVRRARAENERVVVSIFVNPTQFGPHEDYATYPRDLKRDLQLLDREDVDAVFAPSVEQMYPPGYATYVSVEGPLTEGLCGAFRPGHFRGVTTVVLKLFLLVQPTRAYFGEKDYQQLQVVRRMTQDLHLPIEIVGCPIVREPDGLAMSSRNVYLNEAEREQSLSLVRALDLAEGRIQKGERDAARLRELLQEHFARYPAVRVEYIEFVDAETLEPLDRLRGSVRLALAVRIGRTRLIDNRGFQIPEE